VRRRLPKGKGWYAGPLLRIEQAKEKLGITDAQWDAMTPRERNRRLSYVSATGTMEEWEMHVAQKNKGK
jgi:hypothetical protein